jgi:hypothetical protein
LPAGARDRFLSRIAEDAKQAEPEAKIAKIIPTAPRWAGFQSGLHAWLLRPC